MNAEAAAAAGLRCRRWCGLAVQALVRVTILPSGRRGPGFDPDTVLVE
jgi:hypothetical protein